MSITIDLPPEVEVHLREKAARENKPAEVIASNAVTEALLSEARERAEVIEAVRRSDAAAARGKVRSLDAFVADQRAKHGLAASWPGKAR